MPKVSQSKLDARRNQIREAALCCFLRKGVQASTMRDIFAEAGLSAGAVYNYFKTKGELIESGIVESTREYADTIASAAEACSDCRETPLRATLSGCNAGEKVAGHQGKQGWYEAGHQVVLALCIPLALLLLALPSQADPLGEVLDAHIPTPMERHGVAGLNVIVLRDGQEVSAGSFGMADVQTGERMTRDRVFRVESVSKSVTVWGVMQLVERGDVALDDVAWDHVTSWTPPEDTPPMTIRQMLSSTAGLGVDDYTARYPPGGAVPGVRTSVESDFRVISEPGTGFAYSNIGYNVLEILIEDVSGQSFSDFMTEAVLKPLGSGVASFDWTPALDAQMAIHHGLEGECTAPHVYAGRAHRGLLGDVDDIARFVRAGIDAPHRGARTVLPDALIEEMQRPQVALDGTYGVVADGYGLGHFTETLSDGRHAVWHGGQGYGWMSHFHLVPETGDAIVTLANSQRVALPPLWRGAARVVKGARGGASWHGTDRADLDGGPRSDDRTGGGCWGSGAATHARFTAQAAPPAAAQAMAGNARPRREHVDRPRSMGSRAGQSDSLFCPTRYEPVADPCHRGGRPGDDSLRAVRAEAMNSSGTTIGMPCTKPGRGPLVYDAPAATLFRVMALP